MRASSSTALSHAPRTTRDARAHGGAWPVPSSAGHVEASPDPGVLTTGPGGPDFYAFPILVIHHVWFGHVSSPAPRGDAERAALPCTEEIWPLKPRALTPPRARHVRCIVGAAGSYGRGTPVSTAIQ